MSRIRWDDLPEDVRHRVLAGVGATPGSVEDVRFPPGGFTSGLVCILDTTVGSFFVKAVHESSPTRSIELVRDEHLVLSRTRLSYPAPSLLCTVERSGWIVLVSEAVPGEPLDRRVDEAGLVAALDALLVVQQGHVVPDGVLPQVAERYDGLLDHVPEMLRRRPPTADRTPPVELVARAERAVVAATSGDELVHGDLRVDNVLVEPSGRAWLVDWAWGCRGRSWADAVTLACSAGTVSAQRRWRILRDHPVSRRATTDELHGYVDAIAAMYDWAGRRPGPPGLPGLRPWQLEQASFATELSIAAARAGAAQGGHSR